MSKIFSGTKIKSLINVLIGVKLNFTSRMVCPSFYLGFIFFPYTRPAEGYTFFLYLKFTQNFLHYHQQALCKIWLFEQELCYRVCVFEKICRRTPTFLLPCDADNTV
jgi:hypothetical protein